MNDFDQRALTWDDDPTKVQNGQRVAAAIRACVPLHSDMKVLDYGCGTGLLSFPLQPYVGSLLLVDSSSGMLDVVQKKIDRTNVKNMKPLHLDLLQDPLPTQRVDLIMTMLTLHHIPDIPAVLTAFHQLLHPGGTLCIADLDSEDGSFHGEDFHGHHGIDRPTLQKQLEAQGFQNLTIKTCTTIEKSIQDKLRTFPLFLATCRKTSL